MGGSRSVAGCGEEKSWSVLKELFLLISSDTGFCVQEKPKPFQAPTFKLIPKSMLRDPVA